MSEEATIRRGVRNARYTTLPNHVFEDQRLSMEARWLLGYLLSKPDNWTVRMGDIAKKGVCGRDKARRMVNELVEHGYAEKDQQREDGRFGKLSLVIYDEPKEQRDFNAEAASVASLPQTENPSTVNPSTEKPAPVNAALVNTDDLARTDSSKREARESEREEAETAAAAPVSADDPRKFEQRVKRLAALGWPRWDRSSTSWTISQFAALTDAERAEAEAYGPAYLARTGKGGLALGTYFAERKWRDLPPDVLSPKKPETVAAPVWGPVWGAVRMGTLVCDLPAEGPKPSAFMAALLQRDDEQGRLARLSRQATYGWPRVNTMHEQAQHRKGVAVKAELEERLKPLMEPVLVGTETYQAWKREHERRGWPWIPDPGSQPVVYFPAGGPDGLAAFEAAIRGQDGHGDQRQAAE